MSQVTRGKLDVPQLRESRCPLTTSNATLHQVQIRSPQVLNFGVIPESFEDASFPLETVPARRI